MQYERIHPDRLPTDTKRLARALIGVVLVRDSSDGRVAGRIVETEAYVLRDRASHAFIGRRERNASMFLAPFHAYVYFIYGANYCLNVTSESRGEGAAVLIRALEPLEGVEIMRKRRGVEGTRDLCRGPGRLAKAFAVDRSLDGRYLLDDPELWLAHPVARAGKIGVSRRIGITRDAERHLRFYERGNPFVSGPRALSPP